VLVRGSSCQKSGNLAPRPRSAGSLGALPAGALVVGAQWCWQPATATPCLLAACCCRCKCAGGTGVRLPVRRWTAADGRGALLLTPTLPEPHWRDAARSSSATIEPRHRHHGHRHPRHRRQRPQMADRATATDSTPAERAVELRTAVKEGELEAVARLLGDSATVRAASRIEPPVLHLAAINGRVAVVELLLSSGVGSVTDVCRDKKTALHVAAEWGYVDLLRLLIRNGSAIDAPDVCMMTPLTVAAASGEAEPLTLLARAGASLSHQDAQGNQPVHLSALNGHGNTLQRLCELGAPPLATDRAGRTAHDILQRQERFYASEQLDHPALTRCA
jgi:ankyrin repeat protein